jgi:hypothetical protein
MNLRHFIGLLLIAALFVITTALTKAASAAENKVVGGVDLTAQMDKTYTPDELAGVDKALKAINMDRGDMRFNKNYAKGYCAFPVVLAMMDDPMLIAPYMDGFVANIQKAGASPWAELDASVAAYPQDVTNAYFLAKTQLPAYLIPSTPEAWETADIVTFLTMVAEAAAPSRLGLERHDLIRDQLPFLMDWHDVYEPPYGQEKRDAWKKELETAAPDYMYKLFEQINIGGLVTDTMRYLYPLDPRTYLSRINPEAWPKDKPVIVETKGGRIGIGTMGDDEWTGDFTILVDPGGDDHYKDCRIGAAYGTADRSFGYFADLGGNDFYDCGNTNITLGAAVLGVAAFFDLGKGNDRYVGGSMTMGAAAGGIAIFYDDGGTDTYEGKSYTQGAAGFGIGLMIDDATQPAPNVPTDIETPEALAAAGFDNDNYTAWVNAQAFARTLGVAVCSNERGNEVYHAGGVYLHAPLFQDRYQSFSQGFSIGERDIDYAGGIAFLIDYAGNDRYLGDVYNQGVGYWYGAGLLWDGAGNDSYEMFQYGQGSGIHLAVGGVVDVSGNDSYVMNSGLGQGGSHDYAASIMHDRGGNDHYMGMTSCNGTGLTNSVGIFIDRSGDDTYAARHDGGFNWGRPERGTASIGVFVDCGGHDDYLGIGQDSGVWSSSEFGGGIDITPPPLPPAPAPAPGAPPQVTGKAPIPEVCGYKGEINQQVFDELWELSIRWEVGDNRYIVPAAHERLVAFGESVLPYMSKVMNDPSSLASRGFMGVLGPLNLKYPAGVEAIVKENLVSEDDMRIREAMYLVGELKLKNLENDIAALMDKKDYKRRAISVLGLLGSHVADDKLKAMLAPDGEEATIRVAVTTLFQLKSANYDDLRPLLDHPLISIRDTLMNLFVKNYADYQGAIRADLENNQALSIRAQRTLLDIAGRGETEPDKAIMDAVAARFASPDWGMRADAVVAARKWAALKGMKWETIAPLIRAMHEMLAHETEPYVLFAAEEKIG